MTNKRSHDLGERERTACPSERQNGALENATIHRKGEELSVCLMNGNMPIGVGQIE
jgi:hypothetical protein